MKKRTYFLRKSTYKVCTCVNVSHDVYSIIEKKVVLCRVCEDCYRFIADAFKDYDLILLSFNPNPILPSFLRRVDEDVKSQAA